MLFNLLQLHVSYNLVVQFFGGTAFFLVYFWVDNVGSDPLNRSLEVFAISRVRLVVAKAESFSYLEHIRQLADDFSVRFQVLVNFCLQIICFDVLCDAVDNFDCRWADSLEKLYKPTKVCCEHLCLDHLAGFVLLISVFLQQLVKKFDEDSQSFEETEIPEFKRLTYE